MVEHGHQLRVSQVYLLQLNHPNGTSNNLQVQQQPMFILAQTEIILPVTLILQMKLIIASLEDMIIVEQIH